jgi:DNA modification methylase
MKLADLTPDTRNANKGTPRGRKLVRESLQRYGAGRSILLDVNGAIIAGNKTVEAAKAVGMEDVQIVKSDGSKLIAVQRTDLNIDDKAARELAIAYNRASELGLEWDTEVLKEFEHEDIDLSPFWDERELVTFFARTAGEAPEPKLDQAEALRQKWDTKRGQIWEIGKHRLMCGDSTCEADVKRLMDGKKAGLMNTDPPYGVSYANDERPNPGVAKPRVANDSMRDAELQSFLESVFRLARTEALSPVAAWYLWHAHLTQGFFAAAAAAAAAHVILHRQIIWVKPVLLLGRGQYHWKHEPCFMGWVEGHQPPDYGRGNGERDQTTIWEVGSVSNADRAAFNHATPKPVGLFTIPQIKHLQADEICYEPFAGSGPQFVAAQQTQRICYGLEIEPKYVAVALERLSDMGLKPELLNV